MVVEVAGSTIVMVTASAAAIIAAAAMIEASTTYDVNAVTNLAVYAWDRFGSADIIWVETTMTYPGGPLEISGDIPLCFVEPCPLSNMTALPKCTATATRHNCTDVRQAGSMIQVRYEGTIDIGFDAKHGDTLGYVVSGPDHTSSGVVGVR